MPERFAAKPGDPAIAKIDPSSLPEFETGQGVEGNESARRAAYEDSIVALMVFVYDTLQAGSDDRDEG